MATKKKTVRPAGEEPPRILTPPFTEPPEIKDLEIFDGSGKPVARKYAKLDFWVDVDDLMGRMPRRQDRVVALDDAHDIRRRATDIQRRLAEEDRISYLRIFGVLDTPLAILEYSLVRRKRMGGAATPEEKRLCDALGFDEHLFPVVKSDVGNLGEAEFIEALKRGFLGDYGLRDPRSYGRFVSMGFPKTEDIELMGSASRLYFAYFAQPLLDAVSKSGNPDETLNNFKTIIDHVPVKARPWLFLSLGEHPKAVERLSRIH